MAATGSNERNELIGGFGVAYVEEGGSYQWSFPELKVKLVLDLWERWTHEIAVIRKCSSLGQEIGGLLLGVRDSDSPEVLRIESIDAYSAAAIHAVLPLVKERISQQSSANVVGWFRLDPSGTGLTASDESLMRSHFPDCACVLLLIQPSETETSRANFVSWRGAQLVSAAAMFPPSPKSAGVSRPVLREIEGSDDRRRWWLRRYWPALAIVVVLLAGGAVWFQSGVPPPAGEPAVANVDPGPPGINFIAVQDRNLVRIVWDARAPEVRSAHSGKLLITDGNKVSSVDLDTMRLSAGLYWYPASSTQVAVVFRLFETSGNEIVKTATVTLKAARPAPAAQGAKPMPLEISVPPLPTPALPMPPLPERIPIVVDPGGVKTAWPPASATPEPEDRAQTVQKSSRAATLEPGTNGSAVIAAPVPVEHHGGPLPVQTRSLPQAKPAASPGEEKIQERHSAGEVPRVESQRRKAP
jgi:hypothetical protein